MADEPENHTLRLLREIREEQSAFRAEIGKNLHELQIEFAAMRTDQLRANGLLENIQGLQASHGARLNVIDGRLALIERHIGMVEA
jgi:hypothetical protein